MNRQKDPNLTARPTLSGPPPRLREQGAETGDTLTWLLLSLPPPVHVSHVFRILTCSVSEKGFRDGGGRDVETTQLKEEEIELEPAVRWRGGSSDRDWEMGSRVQPPSRPRPPPFPLPRRR